MPRESSENLLRDDIIRRIYDRIGEPGTIVGSGSNIQFEIRDALGGGVCRAESPLSYELPAGRTIKHKTDILLRSSDGRHLAIEVKFLSAVSDQFKCRSFDMLHLKQEYGEKLTGVMVYVRIPEPSSISIDLAKAYSYPYEYFFGLDKDALREEGPWEPFLLTVEKWLQARE